MAKKSVKKSNTYHHGDLKRACINQGLKFLASGKADFSLRDLAKVLGVSHGAPARHFNSKEGLLASIAEEGFLIFTKILKDSIDTNNLKKSFFTMGRSYIGFAMDHPQHYLIMMGERIPNPEKYEGLIAASSGSFEYLLDLVSLLVKQSREPTQDPLKISYCIWSGVHGLVELGIHGVIKKDFVNGIPQGLPPIEMKDYCLELGDQMNEAFYNQYFT